MTYTKPIPLEDLPYTPVELGDMLETGEKEREIEVEGYGKGRLVISKQNKNKPFFYADEANIPANQKAAKQLQIAETAFNAPLLLSPVLGLASGIPKIIKDKTRAQIKLSRMKADESNLEGAVNLNKTVDGVFQMPSNQARDIVKIAKKNKISYKQAEEYYNLKLRGIEPTGTINPGSSVQDLTQRFMQSPKDRFPDGGDIKNKLGENPTDDEIFKEYKRLQDPQDPNTLENTLKAKRKPLPPKVTTNEKMKEALLNDEAIILNPTYRGGKITVRDEADFFDVSAALIGPGQEIKKDAKGRKIPYDRKGVTEFGGEKGPQRDKIYKHLQAKLGIKNITRTEFNKYAKEQIAAEKDLRKAIKLLNLRNYASMKGIDLSEYPTKEAQLEFLNFINKRKRAKDPKYKDYKETFDYGHIISAKTGFRIEDLGLNRISNTEIESARNIESIDPYTRKIIEILQEGNRERGSRRDFIPIVQMMRNSAGSVVEDFVKWKSNQPGAKGTNITKILDKFIPRDQHENYLAFVQKRFYERRKLSGSLKTFIENELGIPYSEFKKMNNKLQLRIRRMYEQDIVESGNIIGRQQYDQAEMWMRNAIDEFIGLHHFSTPKKLRTTKEMGDLYDMSEDLLPRDIDALLDMILPD